MICNSEHRSDDESHNSNSVDLQLFSSDDEDDQSFFEIAIHKTQHKHQGFDDDDDDDEEEQIELRISFSSSFVTSSLLWSTVDSDASKILGRRDLLVVGIDGDRRQCPFSGDFSSSSFFSCSSASPEPDFGKTTTSFQGRVTDINAADALVVPSSATCLDSNRDLTPASCPRKPSEKMTSPKVSNGSGILNFLIKFPAAIKLQKLLASFAKATHEPKVPSSKTTSPSQVSRRLHKFLTKWIVPIRTELGLKNMKSYCSFDDDQYKMDRAIIITSNDKSTKKTMKTKRRGFSNPNSIKSSPAHQAPMINGRDHDYEQSSIQAAIAHCRSSSTPDFCFSTPHHHRPF